VSARDNHRPVQLLIEHAITDDCPDGQPWPPLLGSSWWLVRSIPEQRQTLWRKISLEQEEAPPAEPNPR
jgi:hypothetical protein